MLRTVGNIQQLSLDVPSAAITVTGTPEQIATAEWLTHQLDQPARTQSSSRQNASATFGGDVYLVTYLRSATIPVGVQEIITTLRTVGNVQRIYSYSAPGAIVVRGAASEVEMAEWMIQQLDTQAGNQAPGPHEYRNPRAADDVVRIFYLSQTQTPRGVQDIMTAIRTTGQIMHVYGCTAPRAIAVRDTATRVAVAQRLIDGCEKP
ncbi:MAG: hypothetical protein JWO80_5149 [Bryobacterales bacterium]|nr:hypothetical protein [Bryobacterales bacterium]